MAPWILKLAIVSTLLCSISIKLTLPNKIVSSSSSSSMSSPSIAELLGSLQLVELFSSLQVIAGFGATAIILLATTFFLLKENEGASKGGAASFSSASVIDQLEEIDSDHHHGSQTQNSIPVENSNDSTSTMDEDRNTGLDSHHRISNNINITQVMPERCAACGKEEGNDNKLKSCSACNMVKYCNRECQAVHWPRHKKDCKKRAAEIRNEALFAQPPPNEDCPICLIPLPSMREQTYQNCCGKVICDGCIHANIVTYRKNVLDGRIEIDSDKKEECYPMCPFCRKRASTSVEEEIDRLHKRCDKKDAYAMYELGSCYERGIGVPRNVDKAIELWTQATELGCIHASALLADAYNPIIESVIEGVPKDMRKVFHYYEIAAKGGCCMARVNLGILEARAGNMEASRKHYMIAAAQGNDNALVMIREGCTNGHITKDDYAKAFTAYKDAQEEMRSEHRTKAKAAKDEEKCHCLKCKINAANAFY